ncbi:mitochondrial aldehyde dehydrogenase [Sporothrix bragantina]|uniref:aldehyde dehydrogenase (NAD(+)) n=1 Tax=Sporothrix bragantina TaxID=671064 RepID=A0ABP0CV17_9PEZI
MDFANDHDISGPAPVSFDHADNPEKAMANKDEDDVNRMGYTAEIPRKFTLLSLFAIGYEICVAPVALMVSLSVSIGSGGPATLVWGQLIIYFMALCIVISLAELASAYPNAGGQYYWAAMLAPKPIRRMSSFVVGYISWASAIFGCASSLIAVSQMTVSLVVLRHGDVTEHPWMVFITYQGFNLVMMIFNVWEAVLPKMSRFFLVISISTPLIIIIAILARSEQKQSATFVFTGFTNLAGWNDGIAFLTGLLGVNWGFSGLDGVTHITEEEIAKVSAAGSEDVNKAVQAARAAFEGSWADTPGTERGRLLMKLADLVEECTVDLATLVTLENGKPFSQAIGDVQEMCSVFRYYGGWADKTYGQTIETSNNKFTYTLREPIGVCGQIIPWNYPLGMAGWKLGPCLACGNSTVLKPSELTPLSILYFANLVRKAGVPAGVINIVNGNGCEAGMALVEHLGVDKISFTGSTATGKQIMKAASSTLKNITLETGGKSPVIIFDDADLKNAVKWAHYGIMVNMGQVCTATSRIFVHEKVYDSFIKLFLAYTNKVSVVGDPFDEKTYHGPQVSKSQYEKILAYAKSAKEQGASILLGGTTSADRPNGRGYYFAPTVVGDVKPDMNVYREEIFGPFAVVCKFSGDAEVLKAANDTDYGLAAALFTNDVTRAITVSKKLQAGTVWINSDGASDIRGAAAAATRTPAAIAKRLQAYETVLAIRALMDFMAGSGRCSGTRRRFFDRPVLDADFTGRANPMCWQTTLTVHQPGHFFPCAIDTGSGRTLLLTRAPRDEDVNRLMRSAIAEGLGSLMGLTPAPVSGTSVHQYVVRRSLPLAWHIGRALAQAAACHETVRTAESVVRALRGTANARVLFRGKITAIERTVRNRLSVGVLHIRETNEDVDVVDVGDCAERTKRMAAVATGGSLRIPFVNDNILAEHVPDIDTATAAAAVTDTVPDLIALLDRDTGKPVGVPEYRYGCHVVVLGMACSPRWTDTARGIEISGPRGYRYDLGYEPLGTFQAPQCYMWFGWFLFDIVIKIILSYH